jgi:hypothetical protein
MGFREEAEVEMAGALRAAITRLTEPALREFESLRVAFDVRSEAVTEELKAAPNSIDPTWLRGIIDQVAHRAGQEAASAAQASHSHELEEARRRWNAERAEAETQLASARAEAAVRREADRQERAALTASLEQARAQLDEARAQVEAARSETERALAAPMRELGDTRAQLEDARAQVQQARAELARVADAAAARSATVAPPAAEPLREAKAATSGPVDGSDEPWTEVEAVQMSAQTPIEAGHTVNVEASAPASAPPAGASLPGAEADPAAATVRALDEAGNLTQVLDALLDGLGVVFPRAALFVVVSRSQRLQGRRSIGYKGGAEITKTFELPLDVDSPLTRVVKSGRATVVGNDRPSDRELTAADAQPWNVTLPVMMGDQVVAVVHADRGERMVDSGPSFDGANALTISELLVRHAGHRLAALAASAQMTFSDVSREAPVLPEAVEAPAERPRQEAPQPIEDARRYARLLVSEIRRYTQANVLAGLSDRSLDERLKSEIERCRALYARRMRPGAGATVNCFDEALAEMLVSDARGRSAAVEEPVGAHL